ncbi:MAG: hypothetical protein SGPRY_009589 [Prymnesium sp.]
MRAVKQREGEVPTEQVVSTKLLESSELSSDSDTLPIEEIDLSEPCNRRLSVDAKPAERNESGKEKVKSAGFSLRRSFTRHSRNSSAPPELRKSSTDLYSQRSSGFNAFASARCEVDDSISQPQSEREHELPRIQEATGRTGYAVSSMHASSWPSSWPQDMKRPWRSSLKPTRPTVPEIEVVQCMIVLLEWEEADPDSFSRC